jgi:hypothetical protein
MICQCIRICQVYDLMVHEWFENSYAWCTVFKSYVLSDTTFSNILFRGM